MPGLLSRARDWLARTVRRDGSGVVARAVPTWKQGRPLPLPGPESIPDLVREGLRANLIVDACIDEILESMRVIEFVAKTRAVSSGAESKPLPSTHPLARLLAQPTPDHDRAAFITRLTLNQLVAGQWFTHKLRNKAGTPVELWPLRPDLVRITPGDGDRKGLIGSFTLYADGRDGRGIPIAPTDVIHHLYKPDYLDEWQGVSPLLTACRWIRVDNAAAEFLDAFFENGGAPAGLLIFKRQVDPADRARVRELWKETYGARSDGSTGWHGIGVLDSDVTYEETGSRPGPKLGLEPIFDQSEARICAAFGVPPIMVGLRLGLAFQLSYASYAETRLSFWHETMQPIAAGIAGALTGGLCSPAEFGENLIIEPDYAHVAALAEDIHSRRQWALDGWTGGLLTRDEALVRAGEPPVGGDKGAEYAGAGGTLPAVDWADPATLARGRRLAARLTPREVQIARRAAEVQFRDLMRKHWRDESAALIADFEADFARARAAGAS